VDGGDGCNQEDEREECGIRVAQNHYTPSIRRNQEGPGTSQVLGSNSRGLLRDERCATLPRMRLGRVAEWEME
jgi:hypothetical protein